MFIPIGTHGVHLHLMGSGGYHLKWLRVETVSEVVSLYTNVRNSLERSLQLQ